ARALVAGYGTWEATAAIERLAKLGWTDQKIVPLLMTVLPQKGIVAKALGKIGNPVCYRPLLDLAFNEEYAEGAVLAITDLFSRNIAALSEADLRACIDLPSNMRQIRFHLAREESWTTEHLISTAGIKNSAQHELNRRGMEPGNRSQTLTAPPV